MHLRWLGRVDDAAGRPAESAVVAGNVLACLGCLPLALPVTTGGTADWAIVGYLGLFQIGLAYVWLTRGVRRIPALEVTCSTVYTNTAPASSFRGFGAPQVTRRRMYLEAMTGLLADMKALYIVDRDQKAMVPWLPLESGQQPAAEGRQP